MKRTVRNGGKTLEYTLVCVKGRQNALLQALPEGKVRLYAPKYAHLRDMDQLVLSRWDWIAEMHKKLDEAAQRAAFEPSRGVLIEGERVPVVVERSAKASVSLRDGALYVRTGSTKNENVELEIKKWLCALALTRVREALTLYGPSVGRPYGRVTIREQKTRWGSCSSKKNLNFNWKLIMAPKEALTYVVIHELCHLICFNHSEKFWQEVGKRMPDYDVWRKWLRAHGRELAI